MKMRLMSAALLLAAVPVFAQGPGGPGGPGPMGRGFGFGPGEGGFGIMKPVTNAPYSATFTSTSTEKLQDGTTLTHNTTRVVSRDSLGRTREEVTMPAHGGNSTPHTMIVIIDPVTHTITRLETEKKVAMVHQIPEPRPHDGRRGPGGPPPVGDDAKKGDHPRDKNVTVADLGSKTISGDVATGKRMTRTVPPNTMGNATPIVTTHEEWQSADLRIELSRSDVDPFHGTRTSAVSSLTKAEPSAELFRVPPGYTVEQAPQRAGGFRRGQAPPPPPAGM